LAEQRRIVAQVEALLARTSCPRERFRRVSLVLKRLRLAAAYSGRLIEEWASIEPEGWQEVHLDELCTAIVDCPHSTPKWTDKGEICVRTTNFKPGFLDLSEVRDVSEVNYKERIARLEPRPRAVIYSREAGILGIACIIPPGVRLCLGQRMMLLRPETHCDAQFMMHLLNSPPITGQGSNGWECFPAPERC